MNQHEITAPLPLLNEEGNLKQAGWARKPYLYYDRAKVKQGALRLKEWDSYLVTNGRFALALSIADLGYLGLDCITLLDFAQNWQATKHSVRLMSRRRAALPSTSEAGITASSGKDYAILFTAERGQRTLTAHIRQFQDGQDLDAQIRLTEEPKDSMVICTPFEKKGQFFYNRKINCFRADGMITLGEQTERIYPDETFAALNWGRGVWPHHNTWYWSSASGVIDGIPFGFNFGYGFGDTRSATENVLFYNGRAHKLGYVIFHIPLKKGKYDYLAPWTIESDDGRVMLDFIPVRECNSCTDVKLLKFGQHQVFGHFSGTVILDAGTKIELRDFFGFAERVETKW